LAARLVAEPKEQAMLNLILSHSDHTVAAMFVLIAVVLLLTRPKLSCCRTHRWERNWPSNHRHG
jgi:hypothetical protein